MDQASRTAQTGPARAADPLNAALDQVVKAFDQLLAVADDGGAHHLDDAGLVAFLQRFERLRNRVPLVDHRLLVEAEARGLAETLAQPNLARVLVATLRLSAGEAHRRLRAAVALGPRRAMSGEPLEPRRPLLAAAQRTGEVSPEQVQVIERALQKVDRPGFDPADVAMGERLLTHDAATFEPKVLAQLADQVVDAIDPDGTLPDDRLNTDRRNLMLRPTRDGAWVGEFRLTGVLGAKLSAVLRPLARPRVDRLPVGDDGSASAVDVDERTHGQRMHDALEEVCDRALRSGGLPASGGTPATVVVTITLEKLLDRLGYGQTSDGVLLPAARVLELAEEADIIPAVLNRSGAVLSLGRARRIATTAQTWALVARDGGCSFPGCDRASELCERHHVVAWVDGGATDLDNLTLLCRYHHHQFAGRGWTVVINADGLPEWTPPWWVDRRREPLVNTRIQLTRLARGPVAERARPPELVGAGP